MGSLFKHSDLKYRYKEDIAGRDLPRFNGKPDPAPFNRDDLYEVLPMLEAVMEKLGTYDVKILHLLEDILNTNLPKCISTREEVFDCLLVAGQEWLEMQ
jgi:hypothetical protein